MGTVFLMNVQRKTAKTSGWIWFRRGNKGYWAVLTRADRLYHLKK